MRLKAFLEVREENIVYNEICKKNFFANVFSKGGKKIILLNKIQDIKVNLKNKNLYILVHGQEIYITHMELPRIKTKNIYKVLNSELKNKFKNMDNIMFSYEITKYNRYTLNLIVSCMNWDDMSIVKIFHNRGANIKAIIPIQFYIWSIYKNKLSNKDYIFVLVEDNTIYFMACRQNIIVFNNVFKNTHKEEFFHTLEYFQCKLNIIVPKVKFCTIAFVNFLDKGIIQTLCKNYDCHDFGDFSII